MTYAAYYTSDSLPLTWDKYIVENIDRFNSRLIPTRVGQTDAESTKLHIHAIHSHSRGTNKVRPIFGVVEPDSLPLAWDHHLPSGH